MLIYHITFKHMIGRSTFQQGFTIPKRIYPYITLPEKGQNREVRFLFGNEQMCYVKLYRINNKIGHIQFRYEGKEGEYFRTWLIENFSQTYNDNVLNVNEYIEITILEQDIFRITPFSLSKNNSLYFNDIVTHKVNNTELIHDERFIEIVDAIRNIPFQKTGRQMYYNSKIKRQLSEKAWLQEQDVVHDKRIRLKCDFRKDDMQLEIEFGNARTYYQDLIKFAMSYNAGIINIGGLLVPSPIFSKHLCHLGHLNALQKSDGIKSQYSGMMDFNKASVEFEYIKAIFDIPFFIMSINCPC